MMRAPSATAQLWPRPVPHPRRPGARSPLPRTPTSLHRTYRAKPDSRGPSARLGAPLPLELVLRVKLGDGALHRLRQRPRLCGRVEHRPARRLGVGGARDDAAQHLVLVPHKEVTSLGGQLLEVAEAGELAAAAPLLLAAARAVRPDLDEGEVAGVAAPEASRPAPDVDGAVGLVHPNLGHASRAHGGARANLFVDEHLEPHRRLRGVASFRGVEEEVLQVDRRLLAQRAVRLRGGECVRQPIGEHEVDRLGGVEAEREAGVVGLRQRDDELTRLLHGAADGDPAAGEHMRRDHGRLLLQQQRVGGNVARESRVGEDGLEGGGLARRDAVPRLWRPLVQVRDRVHVAVLDVPAKHREEHPEVEHRRVYAGDVIPHEAQQRRVVAGDLLQRPAGVPRRRAVARAGREGRPLDIRAVQHARLALRS
mmetsp:Transcript_5357/g.16512  ORF Transcript_5357/g.16512 Transcript_5357/m.16512 type:complete len:424 (-) Transcript_5357:345-1616(-)